MTTNVAKQTATSAVKKYGVALKIVLTAYESNDDPTINVDIFCTTGSEFITTDELQNLKKILQDGANQLYCEDGEPFHVVFENMTTVSTDWLDWRFGAESAPSISIGSKLASRLICLGFDSSALSKYFDSTVDLKTLGVTPNTLECTLEEELQFKTVFNELYQLSAPLQTTDHIELQTRQVVIDEELTALCAIYPEEYQLVATDHVTVILKSVEAATKGALDCIRILFCPSVTNYPEEIPVLLITKRTLSRDYNANMADFFTQAAVSEIQAQNLLGTPFIYNVLTWVEENAVQLREDFMQWFKTTSHNTSQEEEEEEKEPEQPKEEEKPKKLQSYVLSGSPTTASTTFFSSYSNRPPSNNNNAVAIPAPTEDKSTEKKKKKKKVKKTTKFDEAMKEYEQRSKNFVPTPKYSHQYEVAALRQRFFPKLIEIQNSFGEAKKQKIQDFQAMVALLTEEEKHLIQDILADIKKNQRANEENARETAREIVYTQGKLNNKDYQFGTRNLLTDIETAYVWQWTVLNFNDTKLTKIPYTIGSVESLQELNLHSNEIETLPPEMENLKNLRKLILTRNKLKQFGFAIEKLRQLTVLKLGFNQFKTIPDEVGALKNLQTLDLERNPLKKIPESFGMLTKLTFLSLQNTNVSVIPPEVGLLPLEVLQLRNTQQKMIPPDVYHKGIDAVLDYLKSYSPEHSDIGGSKMTQDIGSLFNNKEFSDVVFQIEGKLLFAHKLILQARVPTLLQDLGSKDELEIQTLHVELKYDVFEAFLKHVYSESVQFEFANRPDFAPELLSLAQHHNLEVLVAACDHWIKFSQPIAKKSLPQSQFVKNISSLYKRPSSTYDVTFKIDDTLIQADKLILSSRSDYFKSMFASGLREAQSEVVELTDVAAGVFQAIVEYLYTDDVEEITAEIAIDLLTTACTYGIFRLARIAENLIGYSLDVDNVTCILEVALLYKCELLKRACVLFSMLHYKDVKSSEAYSTMSPEGREFLTNQATKWRVSSTENLGNDDDKE